MNPLGYVAIAFFVLLAGGAATLATGLVQLRGLGKAFGSGVGTSEKALRRGLIAGSVGMGSIAGAALAIAAGGPGALLWMWVATLLGMALTYAEVVLAVRHKGKRRDGTADAGPLLYMRGGLGGMGKILALLFAIVTPFTALTMGALFQAQQSAELLLVVADTNPVTVGGALAAVAAALMFMKGKGGRRALLLLAPVAVVAYAVLALIVIGSNGEALGAAIDAIFGNVEEGTAVLGGAAGGSLLVTIQHAFTRATFANESGLGSAALLDDVLESEDAPAAGRAAMVVPLLNGGVLATLTGLAILVSGAQDRRDIVHRDAEGKAMLMALERPHVRGLIPSLERGQVIVLPKDTPLEAGKRYPFVMRANPRGSKLGNFSAEENAMAIPVWDITADTHTLVFRSADPVRRLNAAYDLRIEAEREIRELPNGVEAVILHPVDENIDLSKLKAKMKGPFVQLSDYYFEGGVAEATHPKYGDHLAMFQDMPQDQPQEGGKVEGPVLRTIISFGFRGPYFYDSQDGGRPPSAFVGAEGFEAPVGQLLTLRVDAPARGANLGSIIEGTDEYRTPGWDFLQGTTHAVLRHDEDESLDLVVPVEHTVAEDGTLRFRSAATDIVDFAKADQMKDYTGPFLLPPAYEFEVEVHSSTRLPDELKDRVSLVPLHELPEPAGGSGTIYTPHPGEVVMTDMEGPFLAREGAVLVSDAIESGTGDAGTFALAAIALVLALTTAVVWSAGGGRLLAYLLGSGAGVAFKLAVLVALVVGATSSIDTVLGLAEPLMLATLAINAIAVLRLLPSVLAQKSE